MAKDTTGRIIEFFIDDLNIQLKNTAQVRRLFERISNTLVHQGDRAFAVLASAKVCER